MSATTLPTETNRNAPEIPIEAERILLRTSPPPVQPKLDLEPPKNRISDALRPAEAPKVESPPPKNRLVEPVVIPSQSKLSTDESTIDRAHFPLRALLPETGLLTAVTCGWLMGVIPWLPNWWQSPEVIASVPGAYGLFLAVKWLFHLIGGGYRLTNRQILRVIPGPIPDPDPIDLTMVATVDVEQSTAERFLFVGRIRVTFERDALPPEILGPVGWPSRRAKRIREAMEAARGGSVVALKAA